MKRQSTKKQVVGVAAVVAAVFALAPAAQADAVVFNESAQLNLTGRDVLAAVSLWDPDRAGDGQSTVGVIQGVDFDDIDSTTQDNGAAIALFSGEAGATLAISAIGDNNGRGWDLVGTFLPESADNTQAELWPSGQYIQGGDSFTFSFGFGADRANTDVEVQIVGGGAWNRTDQWGLLTASVGGVDKDILYDRGTPDLITFSATTDASGDLAVVVTQTWGGSGSGRQWNILGGMTVTAALPTFPLSITPNALNPGNYDISWDSQDGKLYDLVSATDLSLPPADWPVYMDHAAYMNIAASAPNQTLENVPGDGLKRFFVVAEKDVPPVMVFEQNFDEGATPPALPDGWTTDFNDGDYDMETLWTLGAPTEVGPPSAKSGANCVGTNLDANYGILSDIWLRTPPIDLSTHTDTGATLIFQHWVDIDPFEEDGVGDKGTVRVLDASDLSTVLETLEADISGLSPGRWMEFSADFTMASLGKSVVLEFVFVSDDDEYEVGSGWYIDDVTVTTPGL